MPSKSLTAFAAPAVPSQFGPHLRLAPKSARRIRQTEAITKYKLGPRIGLGDAGALHFGAISEAAHGSRVVAIKRLPAHFASHPSLLERFQSEARISGRVRDSHVVQLLDVVEWDGELWQVLEYVDGETLHDLQTDTAAWGRQLPIEVCVAIVAGTLRGLYAAHSARHETGLLLGVVHRAVTPKSLMIARSGQVKVIDFGSAQTKLKSSSVDLAGLDGKVSYLSPEQVRRATVDRRSDLFAAGVVLWEALTGRSLFGADGASEAVILDNIESLAIPTPSSLRAEVPKALDKVVLRALQRGVAHRYDSALEFARALEAALPPASMSQVGAYVRVYCETRLARREQLIRTIEESGPELGGIRSQAHSVQALNEEPDEHEDEDEAVTLLAIPVSAGDLGVEPVSRTVPPLSVRARDRTLVAYAAAFVFLILSCFGWRVFRSLPTIARPTPSTALVKVAPTPPGVSTEQSSAPSPVGTDNSGELSIKESVPAIELEQPELEQPELKQPELKQPELKQPELKQPELKQPELKQAKAGTARSPRPSTQGSSSVAMQPRPISASGQATPAIEWQRRRAPTSASSAGCSPPTYLGADGIHHFKEKCL
jgi:serine/threonine protein kinase